MGQKVNPNGFRYGITRDLPTTWFSDKKHFTRYLLEDALIRRYLKKFKRSLMIGGVSINRDQKNNVVVTIHTARPGATLGRDGQNIKKLTDDTKKATKNHNLKLTLKIVTIDQPELNPTLVAEEIAKRLENRENFRIVQKNVIRSTLKAGAKGVKTVVAGRLNGADMARREGYTRGTMSLHTLRQNIQYGSAIAHTTYGSIGVKVWVSLGETRARFNEETNLT